MRDEVSVLPLMFEAAVTISILTLLVAELADTSGTHLDSFDRNNQVFHFSAISTNVLDGTRPYFTRYQRKVLSTIKLVAYTPGDDLVPSFTTTTTNAVILLCFNTFYRRVNNSSIEVFREKKVASCTYQQIRFDKLAGNGLSLFHRTVLHKTAALSIDAKCIVLQQTIITQVNHYSLSFII